MNKNNKTISSKLRRQMALVVDRDLGKELVAVKDELKDAKSELNTTKLKLKKLIDDSMIDLLTKRFNLNWFIKFKKENFDIKNPKVDYGKTGLVYIDINGLKSINDTYGHSVGDIVIKRTASFLKSKFHKRDFVIHLYGDEFVVVCENDNSDIDFEKHLNVKVKRITDSTKKIVISVGEKKIPLSFASGVAIYDDKLHDGKKDKSIEDTSLRAEQGMYRNKKEMGGGR